MKKYLLPVVLIIVGLCLYLGAKPSWMIHSDRGTLEGVSARIIDIENNFYNHDTITATFATITSAALTASTITSAIIATGTIKSGDSLKTTKLSATTGTIYGGDSLKSSFVKSSGALQASDTTKYLYFGAINGPGYRIWATLDTLYFAMWVTNAYVINGTVPERAP